MNIYLDHNVIDDVSKGFLSLSGVKGIQWVYSNETFCEIKRAGDRRFLSVLREIKARKIELVVNEQFQITEEARMLDYSDPEKIYDDWLEVDDNASLDDQANLDFVGRLFGADNKTTVLSQPSDFARQIELLLEPYGLYDQKTKGKVESVSIALESVVNGPMQKIGKLEDTRKAFGGNKGRIGILADHDNPLESIWALVESANVGLTADQFYSFDPIDKQGYEKWPLYLGIVGCHSVLNFLGFKPDKGLSKVSALPGILSDGRHTAIAAYCDAVMSQDKKFCSEARAIYKYKSVKTKVLELKAV